MNYFRLIQAFIIFIIIFPLTILNPWLAHLIMSGLLGVDGLWGEHILSTVLTVLVMSTALPHVMRWAVLVGILPKIR